jgi:hypothetical protein
MRGIAHRVVCSRWRPFPPIINPLVGLATASLTSNRGQPVNICKVVYRKLRASEAGCLRDARFAPGQGLEVQSWKNLRALLLHCLKAIRIKFQSFQYGRRHLTRLNRERDGAGFE